MRIELMTYGFGDRCSTTELNSHTDCKRVKMIKGELDKPQNKTHTRIVYSLILRARICTLHEPLTLVLLCLSTLYSNKRLPIPPPQYKIYMKRRLLFMFLFLLSDNFYILIFYSKFINFSMSIKENIYMISTDFSTNIFCCINGFTNFYL